MEKINLMEKFSTSEAVRLLRSGDFTYFPGVPTMFHYLLQATRSDLDVRFLNLRLCVSAGAIMPATLNREFENHFSVPLLDGYGIRDLDHGDHELVDWHARYGFVWHSGPWTCDSHHRFEW